MIGTKFLTETHCRLLIGALFTFATALIVQSLATAWGLLILTGALFAILQWALVDFFELARRLGASPSAPALWLLINGTFLCACRGVVPSLDAWGATLQMALYMGFSAFIARSLKRSSTPLLDIFASVLGALYLAWPLASLLNLILSCGSDVSLRQWWAIYAVAVAKMTDIGAWYVGSRWGSRPLGPISPRKTIEGVFGGMVAGFVVGSLLTWGYPCSGGMRLGGFLAMAPLHLAVSSIAQLGDLFESQLKRSSGLRHSGHLPGLGGILDLIDSLLFTFPLLYLVRCV